MLQAIKNWGQGRPGNEATYAAIEGHKHVYSKLRFSLLSHIVNILVELYGAPNKMEFLNDGATDRAKLFLQVASKSSERRTLIMAPSETVLNLSAEHLHILTNSLQRSRAVNPAVPGSSACTSTNIVPSPSG